MEKLIGLVPSCLFAFTAGKNRFSIRRESQPSWVRDQSVKQSQREDGRVMKKECYGSFAYRKNRLFCESVELKKISEKVSTPCYVYSQEAITSRFHALSKPLEAIDSLVCFAVKSNSNLSILKLLNEQGSGFDIVSGGELFRLKKIGVAGSRIIFSGVGKTRAEIESAVDYGIFSFNVESLSELKLISKIAVEKNKRARVAFRFNPDVNPKTHPYISTGLKKNKFGLNEKEILGIVSALPANIDLKGISIHIGSQILSFAPLKEAYLKLFELVRKIEKTSGVKLEFLDLGGGFGVSYKNEKSLPLSKTAAQIAALCKKEFKTRQRTFKILIEPGRSIVAHSGALLSEVLYLKTRSKKSFAICDAGMTELIRPSLYEAYHEIAALEPRRKKRMTYEFVGPVCESSDFLAHDRKFETDLSEGDLIAVLSAGAYGFTMSSTYNTRPKVTEVLVSGSEFKVIREREQLEDLIQGE